MSDLFKVAVTEYWLYDAWLDPSGQPCAADAPGARHVRARHVRKDMPGAVPVRKESRKWYGRVPGKRQPVPLSANKVAAKIMLGEQLRCSTMKAAGVADPYEKHRKRPLVDHLDEWDTALKAGGASAKHRRYRQTCVRAVLDGCGFVFQGDLSASRVLEFVAGLRDGTPCVTPVDPVRAEFTHAELVKLLGVSSSAISPMVRRHRLQAFGSGKSRRYPRATVEALVAMRSRGQSIRTSNVYLIAVKQFVRWMCRDRRMGDNPLAHLSGVNEKLDRRHDRRALSAEELRAVIRTAMQSTRVFRGLTGPDRAMLYSVACVTGFRATELASLAPGDFDLEDDPPTVKLAALDAKNGKGAVQPLPIDLVDDLRSFLASRPADWPVWSGAWADDAAEMFRGDLDAAGLPYFIEGPDGPLFADFHALRHSFIALLDKSGATLKEAMQLARHSDPRLTMAVYGRARLHDLGSAVGRLPSLLESPTSKRLATGTEG